MATRATPARPILSLCGRPSSSCAALAAALSRCPPPHLPPQPHPPTTPPPDSETKVTDDSVSLVAQHCKGLITLYLG